MAVRDIIRLGHPLLRETAKPVPEKDIASDNIQQLIVDLWETKEAADGLGLAAPQIAECLQIAVIEVPSESSRYQVKKKSQKFTVINPVIEYLDSKKSGLFEACLSLPGLRGYVERPQKIKVDFLNQHAQPKQLILEGFIAVVFQHEIDHLFGKLYIDRMESLKTLSFEEEYAQFFCPED